MKLDEIKRLAAKKDYESAAEIARELNWAKVKNWQALATAINVFEAVGDYEEARDMGILAYNRNLGGRQLVYKLTQLFIKVGDFDNANTLYEEYRRASSHSVDKYILLYDLRKAEKASDNELIGILEEYKSHEVDEKYMYELARLYKRTGRKEECLKTCDNVVLWFQDGIYVERCIKLKNSLNAGLTTNEKKILQEAQDKKEDLEATKEALFEKQKELIQINKDDVEDVFREDEGLSGTTAQFEAVNIAHLEEEEDEFIDEAPVSNEPSEETAVFDLPFAEKKPEPQMTVPMVSDNGAGEMIAATAGEAREAASKAPQLNVPGYEKARDEGPISLDLVKNNQDSDIKEFIIKAFSTENKKNEALVNKSTVPVPKVDRPEVDGTVTSEGSSELSSKISKASLNLKELIENARQKNDDNYDKINKEHEEEQREELRAKIDEEAQNMDINVPVPNYNLYDTQKLQATLAEGMSEFFKDEEDDVKTFVPGSSKVTPSSEAQVAATADEELLEDEQIEGQMDLSEWMQSMKEEKYGSQDTKEFSKTELEKYLDEKDEKSAAYEKMLELKKAEAASKGKDIDHAEAARQALEQMIINSVKMDLAIRTGKASARLEEAANAAKNEVKVEVPLVTAQIPAVSEEMLSNISDIMEEEQIARIEAETINAAEAFAQEEMESQALAEASVTEEAPVTKPKKPKRKMYKQEDDEKKLTGELAKIFRKYKEMPGLEEQLVDLFQSLDPEMNMRNSVVGNILISGNSSSDKAELARAIVRGINAVYPEQAKRIAKTTGDSINQRGIIKAMAKLRGTVLIVEGAGTIQPKRINELLTCLEQDTDRMIVIFEDSDAEMNVLINFNPELTNVFNHRITLKKYTVNELVEMAKRFARKRQYEVEDDALLELYLKIDKLHSENDNIKLDDIKEIINQAIFKSERRASRRFFGGLKKKRGENGDMIFLTEADFKD